MNDYTVKTEEFETYLFYPCIIGQEFDYFVKELSKIQGRIILRSAFQKELPDGCEIPTDRQREFGFENVMPRRIQPAVKVLISHANLDDLTEKYKEWEHSPEYSARIDELSELDLKRAMKMYPEDFEGR